MKDLRFFLLFFLAVGCSNSPLVTTEEAEEAQTAMTVIRNGMSDRDILSLMGRPEERKIRKIGGRQYEIWFYLTEGAQLGQMRLLPRNFTPFIFENRRLIGWGERYYSLFFDVNQAQESQKEEERQQYTNDREEWPPEIIEQILAPPSKKPPPAEVPEAKPPEETAPLKTQEAPTPQPPPKEPKEVTPPLPKEALPSGKELPPPQKPSQKALEWMD